MRILNGLQLFDGLAYKAASELLIQLEWLPKDVDVVLPGQYFTTRTSIVNENSGYRHARAGGLREGRHYIGLAELVALKEERFAARLGESIGEAVAEVEACWMPAFAIDGISLPGDVRLFLGDWFDRNAGLPKERVVLPCRLIAAPGFHDDGDLEETRGRNAAPLSVNNRGVIRFKTRFAKQNS